tara:strand:- start:515 stop:988 length:474 start_codon:yes stop_codon:yes gene_type:complete
MASTSTNKQPLLVDHIFHYLIDTNNTVVSALDVGGTNSAAVVLDSTTADGAIVEAIYVISRGTTAHTCNFYLSTAADFLRPTQGLFLGSITSGTSAKARTNYDAFPKVLAPLAATGSEPQVGALYIPKGYALWVARENANAAAISDGPIFGVQGGWY